jgi:hypothetical protein
MGDRIVAPVAALQHRRVHDPDQPGKAARTALSINSCLPRRYGNAPPGADISSHRGRARLDRQFRSVDELMRPEQASVRDDWPPLAMGLSAAVENASWMPSCASFLGGGAS